MKEIASELEQESRYGTAHVYRSTGGSVAAFLNKREISLWALTPQLLKEYEEWMRRRGLSWDTVGTYMHTLQAIYNRGVDRGVAPYIPRLFKGVFTGRASERKRALPVGQVRRLLVEKTAAKLPDDVEHARTYLELMLRFQGMPFVDLANLQKSDWKGDHLILRRQKTGHELSVAVDDRAAELLRLCAPADPSSPYLLDILPAGLRGKPKYVAYQSHLRTFNIRLKRLSQLCGVSAKVTSYSMRYTWATQSKYCGIPIGIISEGLGHGSVKTTEVYLKRFEDSLLDKANIMTMDYIFKDIKRRWK